MTSVLQKRYIQFVRNTVYNRCVVAEDVPSIALFYLIEDIELRKVFIL